MNKLIMILSIIGSFLFAQIDMEDNTFGIGFDFHMFPTSYINTPSSGYYYNSNSVITDLMGFYLSYQISGFIIEPSFSSYTEKVERDYNEDWPTDFDYSNKWQTISLGVFKIMNSEDVRAYYGARIGKSWYNYEHSDDDIDDTELDNVLFAPTFGAEYFIGNNFSFGGEVRYKILSFEDTETNSQYDLKQETTSIEPKFLVRFYF